MRTIVATRRAEGGRLADLTAAGVHHRAGAPVQLHHEAPLTRTRAHVRLWAAIG
jgi:hypothetical protein